MTDPGEPVRADTDTMARLITEFESGTTTDFEAYAADLGVTPPDDRQGWGIVYRFGPDGQDLGLFWVHPDDEPIQQVD